MGAEREDKRGLPTGTVTFMFTDIEGSTRLLQSLGTDTWVNVLAEHDEIMRTAISEHGGIEVNTEGDAFFVVFHRAVDAVAAGIEAQRRMASANWPDGVEVRVRMGLHTGEGRLGGSDYIGMAVVHAARVAAVGHGGQILLSSECKGALGALPANAAIRSLGHHRLKDLGPPIELHQLCHPELSDVFPALRTLDRVRHNLPIQPSSFLGRADELRMAAKILGTSRLLSLTGPGGTGKSRLAFQVAAERLDDFLDGVWVAELADYSDPALVPHGLLSAVGVNEEPGRTPTETLVDFFSTRAALVVLDNCEHVIDAAAALTNALLRAGAGLQIIATSREPLRVAGEAVLALAAMGLPDETEAAAEDLASSDAVRLFCERAGEVTSAFALSPENAADVAAICSRLDGIPLAIELAAAWTRSLSPGQISERLSRSLDLLNKGPRGAHGRHSGLRAAISWSHDLLSPAERTLFARLSVFAGGWTLESAEAVCSGDGIETDDVVGLLDALVDKSLVATGRAGRFRFLATVGSFATEQLAESGQVDALRDRLAHWCTELARRVAETPKGSIEEARAFDVLEEEDANCVAVLSHLRETGRNLEEADLAILLSRFWDVRAHWEFGRAVLDRCLETVDTSRRGLLLEGLAWLTVLAEDHGPAVQEHCEEALALARQGGDEALAARLLVLLADHQIYRLEPDFDLAESFAHEALTIAPRVGDRRTEARALAELGNRAFFIGDYDGAESYYKQAVSLALEVDDRQQAAGILAGGIGAIAERRGDLAEAQRLREEGLEMFRSLGARDEEVESLYFLAGIALERGEITRALGLYEECSRLAHALGMRRSELFALSGMATPARITGDYETARISAERALAGAEEARNSKNICARTGALGIIAVDAGEFETARTWLLKALALADEIDFGEVHALCTGYLGLVLWAEGDSQARVLLEQSRRSLVDLDHREYLGRVLGFAGDAVLSEGDLGEATARYRDMWATAGPTARPGLNGANQVERVGMLLSRMGRLEEAAEFLAAADSLCAPRDEVRGAVRRPQYEEALETCREGLDAEAFRAARERGAQLDWAAVAARAKEVWRETDSD